MSEGPLAELRAWETLIRAQAWGTLITTQIPGDPPQSSGLLQAGPNAPWLVGSYLSEFQVFHTFLISGPQTLLQACNAGWESSSGSTVRTGQVCRNAGLPQGSGLWGKQLTNVLLQGGGAVKQEAPQVRAWGEKVGRVLPEEL